MVIILLIVSGITIYIYFTGSTFPERKYDDILADISQLLVVEDSVTDQIKEKIRNVMGKNEEIIYMAIWKTDREREDYKLEDAVYCYPDNINISGLSHGTIGTINDYYKIIIGYNS